VTAVTRFASRRVMAATDLATRMGDDVTTMNSPVVLCIDDLPQVLALRKAVLESHGYCVKLAVSGYAAMKVLEGTPVEVVLLEYRQEGIHAEAIAGHIKQRFPNLPIILLSAHAETPERILWLVDEYVLRSELPQGLVSAVERATHATPEGRKLAARSAGRVRGVAVA
jgi:CheY-like chemotaxis protein